MMNSPLFLIIGSLLAVLIVCAIAKHAIRLVFWIFVICLVLICLGTVKWSELIQWFENLLKMAE